MKTLTNRITLTGALALLLLGTLGAAEVTQADGAAPDKTKTAAKAPERPQMPPATVLVEPALLKENNSFKKYVGHTRAFKKVSLPARVSGVLQEAKFQEGDLVTKGQLLFVIEDTTYRAKARMAQASVAQCKAEMEYAENNYHRQKVLYDKKAVSEAVYDEAIRLRDSCKAKLANAEATLIDAENDLSYTRIYAPIDGRIGKSTYSTGNYVTPSSQVLNDVVAVSPVYLVFSISERDYLDLFGSREKMRTNAAVQVRLANNQLYSHPGKIVIIDNKIDDATGTITVWATLENPDSQLNPGGYTTVYLGRKGQGSYPAVKLSAVMTDKAGNYVYTVNSDNKVSRRNIKPGAILGNYQLVESGLQPNELVIVDGTHKTMPGGTVVPVRGDSIQK